MANPVVEAAGESAASAAEAIVEGAVAQVEAAVENAEARADAAEAALEAVVDSARRDELHDEIEEVGEELEAWQSEHGAVHEQLNQRLTALEERCNSLQEQLTTAENKLILLTVSTPPVSPEGTTAPQPGVTVATINPESAAPAPMPAAPVVPANRRPWI